MARIFIVREHLAHFISGETEHLVEIEEGRDIPSNVETAGKIVEGYGAYSREEYSLKRALELLEHVTIEALGMGQLVIYLFALLAQHYIREVVILVDDKIHRDAELVGYSGYLNKFSSISVAIKE